MATDVILNNAGDWCADFLAVNFGPYLMHFLLIDLSFAVVVYFG